MPFSNTIRWKSGEVFDKIVANELETENGKAVGFTLNIYGEKAEVMEREFFEEEGLREDTTLYVGDSEDDEPIADILVPGNFIVSFFASDDFKERMSSKHKAFVPKSEEDLRKYIDSR